MGVKNGNHENSVNTKFVQTNRLVIESDKPISCNYDGEKMTSQRFEIEVLPQAINYYYDEEMQEEYAKIKIKK